MVVGGFWGDEGKGKIISYLAFKKHISIGVRGGVGPNAGHTVQIKGRIYKMRMLPSSFVYENSRVLVGAGVLVNPEIFLNEIKMFNGEDRVGLDQNCGIIEQKHIDIDQTYDHLVRKVGTTGTGTGPCNADRIQRIAKTAKDIPVLQKYIADVAFEVNKALDEDKNVIIEGTQGTLLSVYHGSYPYCTSKDVTASSICADVGVGPTRINDVLVVFKAYITRVGGGHLPGELSPEDVAKRGWTEVGTVTGRPRRVAPFSIELAKRAIMLNGATQVAITKLDAVFPESRGVKNFDGLSQQAKEFLSNIEKSIKIPITMVGTGPEAEDIIDMEKNKSWASKRFEYAQI